MDGKLSLLLFRSHCETSDELLIVDTRESRRVLLRNHWDRDF